jgi:GNAT superfamily N-acetyltransferase
MVFVPTDPSHPDAQALIAALDADLQARYPGVSLDPVDTSPLVPPRGVFIVGRVEGRPVACGGWRTLDDATVELKRMYVDPSVRRRGQARALVSALEDAARERGFTVVRIETGDNQPEAVALYERCGYTRIPPFGEYVGNAWSICWEKLLGP